MAKNKRSGNKKAIFFSLDALIALIIILMTIMVIYPVIRYSEKESAVPGDIISVLSELKIGEMDSILVRSWIGVEINDTNKSVLEQIGDFYVNEETRSLAEELAREVLLTINTNENIGIWIEGDPDYVLIASRNTTSYEDAKTVNVERQIISGIHSGEETTGYSARAFLSNTEQTKYYYFGGYVGEGNITLNVEYNGTLKNVSLEIAASKNFTICINEHDCSGSFEPAVSEFEPKNFSLSAYILDFDEGKNNLTIVPKNGGIDFHIAGGYLKLTYSNGVQYEQPVKYYFPGIKGIINLYDGFYVPGDLINLSVNIKAKVNDPAKKMYMKIGDVLIFNESTGGIEKNIVNTSEEIENLLISKGKSYSDFSNKTIPIRIGIEGVDYLETEVIAEVFSSPSLSASSSAATLKAIVDGTEYSSFNAVTKTNEKLVESVLGIDGDPYLGLTPTGAGGIVDPDMYHELSQDENSLISKIENEWAKGNNKDICAGIQMSFDNFTEAADFRAIILTVFDEPNRCEEWKNEPSFIDGLGTLEGDIKTKVCNLADPDGLGGNDPEVRIYTVDVGLSTPAESEGIQMLKDIADCSNGKYFRAEVSGGLMDAYNDIITTIKDLIYNMQVIDVIRSANADSYLSPESYIEFDYQRTPVRPGIVLNFEEPFSSASQGSFNIPPNSDIAETKVISYSGSRWTDNVTINGTSVYTLSDYGSNYILLGDPYAINIPNSKVN
ncbi:MAG: hypothetical protein Q8N63_04580, partial [Nanoarchaeota archaeon]|nr:hypothetical protein [Nanoarchaeota archaeon]